jgi:putative ATP-dependent endonuclease of OLD family
MYNHFSRSSDNRASQRYAGSEFAGAGVIGTSRTNPVSTYGIAPALQNLLAFWRHIYGAACWGSEQGKNMHLSRLTLVNYRNFESASLHFNKGVNTLVGENSAGKSNVFRAIRLLLDDSMARSSTRLQETDFHRGIGNWRGHWIVIRAEFDELSLEEAVQALFMQAGAVLSRGEPVTKASYTLIFRPKKHVRTKLAAIDRYDVHSMHDILDAVTEDDYETVFYGRGEVDLTSKQDYLRIVGDFETAEFNAELEFPELGSRLHSTLTLSREVACTYVQALRDVVSEFHNSRTNPLLSLLKSKSGALDPVSFEPILAKVEDINSAIQALDDVVDVRQDIRRTITDAVGHTYSPSALSIRSDLPAEADRLFQSLKLFVGESGGDYEGPIHELSLGGANLMFLTLKLLEFHYQRGREMVANLLLIEEPEAHLHTHVQKTLFEKIGDESTQIIYSTHSTHISEVSNIENVNILARTGTHCEVYHPSAGLDPIQVGNVHRYLDAVRSNLLFAKSVVLVEGDAEEILIPTLVRKVLGLGLDELGISLINIRSTGFKNVAVLFHDDRVRRRCAIVTDSDHPFMSTKPQDTDDERALEFKKHLDRAAAAGASRELDLDLLCLGNQWLSAFYADHTFEIDMIKSGNHAIVSSLVDTIYTKASTIEQAREDIASSDASRYGRRVLTMANSEGKGWFAVLLAKNVDWKAVIPTYIWRAICFAHGSFSRDIVTSILRYRALLHVASGSMTKALLSQYMGRLELYRRGEIDRLTLRADAAQVLGTGDPIVRLLADMP